MALHLGFRPKVKTAGPGIRMGGRSQYNRPTFCFICCRSTTIFLGGSFSLGGALHPLPLAGYGHAASFI